MSEHRLGAWPAVRLIAGRELATRIRSKAYLATTLILAGLTVVLAVGSSFINTDSSLTVALTSQSASLSAPLQASAKSVGTTAKTRMVPSDAAGRELVRKGDVDALLTVEGGQLTAVVQRDAKGTPKQVLDVLAGRVAFDQQISDLGGDPSAVQAAVAAAHVDIQSILPPRTYDTGQLVLGIAVGILIYLSLLTAGQMVAQGVVEEKSTRVVELLLATIRPWQLMAGKVLGIGLLGLLQVVVIGGAGAGAAAAAGTLDISFSAAAGTVVWLVAWFVLGFVMYALAFAAAAATVSRQEDAQSVVFPIMMFLIIGYVAGISVLPSDPANRVVEVMSVIPVFAPTLMPMRLAIGGVPWWEAGLAIALAVAMVPLLVAVGGRIYRNAVVRSGARVKLREAFKAQ